MSKKTYKKIRYGAFLFVAFASWLSLVVAGFLVLFDYETRAGSVGLVPQQWPEETRLDFSKNEFCLVMFIHPRCPCTAASLEELSKIMSRLNSQAARGHLKNRTRLNVVVLSPSSVPDSWVDTALLKTANTVPNSTVIMDRDGHESHLFGAMTSGHVVLYSPGGKLLFSGGVTGTRGHVGDNAGSEAVVHAVQVTSPIRGVLDSKVFGCALGEPLCGASDSGFNLP